jgi:hypothetical protein
LLDLFDAFDCLELLEFLPEILDLGAEALSGALGLNETISPAASVAGPILVGAIGGFASAWLFPDRLIEVRAVIPQPVFCSRLWRPAARCTS